MTDIEEDTFENLRRDVWVKTAMERSGQPSIDFSGFVFPRLVDKYTFSSNEFSKHVNFSRATFKGPADFNLFHFRGAANFGGTAFERDARFSGATFRG